ncbi:MAG: sulfatase-like hydrolase/transferase [Planctomycetota bacterium]
MAPTKLSRVLLPALFFLGALPTAALAQQTATNTLVLIADDLGVDQVGIYGEGSSPAPTPNLDTLARSGVLFRNAWAHPTCSPTRAALHTGRYPHRTGIGFAITGNTDPVLALAEHTLPELVRANGFATALIGKWHLGTEGIGDNDAPNLAGWSHFAGAMSGAVPSYYAWQRVVNGRARLSTNYCTTQEVDDALAWIGTQSSPWLCVVAFHAPHTPYQEPPSHLHSQDLTGRNPVTEPRPFYRAMVEAMDQEIGRLLAGLGAARAQTNVIFLGDNGTPAQIVEAPFVRSHAKGSPYEGGVRVPLIVEGPAVTSPGRESAALVTAVDVFATVTALCGVDARANVPTSVALDGIDFVGTLSDPNSVPARTIAFSEAFDDDSADATTRDARHKLIRRQTDNSESLELYDLAGDPFESVNLMSRARNATQQRAFEDLYAALASSRDEGLALGFGSACSIGTLAAGTPGPTLGSNFPIALSPVDPSTSGVVILLGLSRDQIGSTPLPFALESLGMPGCYLLTSIEDAIGASLSTGAAELGLAIPSETALIGARFHLQASELVPGSNPTGITMSNGLACVIGR